jgi:ribonuclease VapC
MVIDTSALLAILLQEADAESFAKAIASAEPRLLSAANLVEAGIVAESRVGADGARDLDLLIVKSKIEVRPVTVEQAELARLAFRKFGKGRHRAGLNFWDCFAYALAKDTGEPLLFKGDDFNHTDIANY